MYYNVLLVEDDRRTAESLASQLRVMGHTVSMALSPRLAMQTLNQVIPDVIFMDINMPGINGLEVVRFLRRDPVTSMVPVVVVTANDSPEIKEQSYEAGADYFLVKPTSIEDLEAALNHVLRNASPPYS